MKKKACRSCRSTSGCNSLCLLPDPTVPVTAPIRPLVTQIITKPRTNPPTIRSNVLNLVKARGVGLENVSSVRLISGLVNVNIPFSRNCHGLLTLAITANILGPFPTTAVLQFFSSDIQFQPTQFVVFVSA